jgi:flagellar biogenesis protein FliO
MRFRNKWLLIPPAAALLLFLGPLRPLPVGSDTGGPAAARSADAGPALPRAPDLVHVGSTLVGVLLLAAAGLFLLARLRHGKPSAGGAVFRVRQSLRLGPRQQLWAVEFDDQLLLLGENDGTLAVLGTGRPERDEAPAGGETLPEPEPEGAVPRDLVIPRPERAPILRAGTGPARRAPSLGDFRSLLQKAGKA